MYTSSLNLVFVLIIFVHLVHKTTTLPLETSSIYSINQESSPISSPIPKFSTVNDQVNGELRSEIRSDIRPEISETVSKILRLMHSLSNKSILIPSSPVGSVNSPNFNLDLIKRDNNLRNFDAKDKTSLNLKLLIENDKLNEKLKKLSKINQELNENLNQKLQTERFNNDFTNGNLFEKLRELNKKEEFGASNAKYPNEYDQSNKFNRFSQEQPKTDFISAPIQNPTYIKLLSKLNEKIEEERKEANRENINNKDQFDQFEFKDELKDELKEDLKDELNHLKDQKKNLYDMVENEEEDNLGEEEHMHNYNISLLSDLELNRTLMDIQYLLNNNLSKQEMETKFSSKGRNNRNKIAQRMEYFEQLYRNIHNLSLPQNQKRGEGELIKKAFSSSFIFRKIQIFRASSSFRQVIRFFA